VVLAVMVCVGWMASPSRSQQKAGDKPAQQGGGSGMTAEQKEMMKKMAAPVAEHDALKPMVGKFNCELTSAMPGMAEQKSSGVSNNEMVLGGRFLQQRFEGKWDGEPFSGMGYTGFDTGKKKYVGTWMDTMGTMMLVMEGTADSAGKVITCTATMDDPMSGQKMTCRMVTTVVSNDKHTFEMYMPGPDGKEFKGMTIVYTRAK
jgi:hypothetical protein